MTCCICALCEEKTGEQCKAIVVASDRMVTLGGGFIEFEHAVPKITQLTAHSVALVAGDALRGAKIVNQLKLSLPTTSISIAELAKRAGQIYAQCRDEAIEVQIFRPRGITRNSFYMQLQQSFLQGLTVQIDEQVRSYDYEVEIMIAGIDDSGGHLYRVNNPGADYTDYHQISYHAIGSGAIHAMQSMIGFAHTPNSNLERTLLEVYVSKKRGEVASGVGEDTDLMVIREDGIHTITEKELEQLEAIYQEYNKPLEEDFVTKVSSLNILKENDAPKK